VQAGDAAVEAAQGQLDLLRRGGAPATQAAVQAQVTSAQALVKATQARLDALTNGGVQAQRAQLQAQHDQAASQLIAAQDNLNVGQAEAQLRSRATPYTDQDVQAAQAAVDQAQAAVELAQLGVRETKIVAPVDGIVFDRQVSPGALVGPTSPIVVLIPPALEVAINVDEAQLGNVWQGQHVA